MALADDRIQHGRPVLALNLGPAFRRFNTVFTDTPRKLFDWNEQGADCLIHQFLRVGGLGEVPCLSCDWLTSVGSVSWTPVVTSQAQVWSDTDNQASPMESNKGKAPTPTFWKTARKVEKQVNINQAIIWNNKPEHVRRTPCQSPIPMYPIPLWRSPTFSEGPEVCPLPGPMGSWPLWQGGLV